MRSLAILGSARPDGNSASVLRRLIAELPCDVVDLQATPVAPYSYSGRYPAGDPFLTIVERMTRSRVTLIATPVYWSSYSSVMKGFLERFFDVVVSERALGGRLRGRPFALVASGSDSQLDPALNLAFTDFCDTLGVRCIGLVYARENGEFSSPEAVDLVRREIAGF